LRAEDRHKVSGLLVDLFACFLLPAYTLLFAGSVEWFGTNFSVLAVTGEGHYRGFFLWGVLGCAYFAGVLAGVGRTFSHRWQRVGLFLLALLACGCLVGALAVPYLPGDFPGWADLHVLLSFSACVLLMAALLWALLACRRENRAGCRTLFWGWWAIVAVSAALFAAAGMVSSALEVFFTISAALLARGLWYSRQSDGWKQRKRGG